MRITLREGDPDHHDLYRPLQEICTTMAFPMMTGAGGVPTPVVHHGMSSRVDAIFGNITNVTANISSVGMTDAHNLPREGSRARKTVQDMKRSTIQVCLVNGMDVAEFSVEWIT